MKSGGSMAPWGAEAPQGRAPQAGGRLGRAARLLRPALYSGSQTQAPHLAAGPRGGNALAGTTRSWVLTVRSWVPAAASPVPSWRCTRRPHRSGRLHRPRDRSVDRLARRAHRNSRDGHGIGGHGSQHHPGGSLGIDHLGAGNVHDHGRPLVQARERHVMPRGALGEQDKSPPSPGVGHRDGSGDSLGTPPAAGDRPARPPARPGRRRVIRAGRRRPQGDGRSQRRLQPQGSRSASSRCTPACRNGSDARRRRSPWAGARALAQQALVAHGLAKDGTAQAQQLRSFRLGGAW